MFIITCNFLPCSDRVEILVPLKNEVSTFTAKIRRIEKIDDSTYHTGVELLDPPKNYVEFVDGLRSVEEP